MRFWLSLQESTEPFPVSLRRRQLEGMTNSDEMAVCFDFSCKFEDASPKERPSILRRWCLAYPEHAEMMRALALDIIRDERRERQP